MKYTTFALQTPKNLDDWKNREITNLITQVENLARNDYSIDLDIEDIYGKRSDALDLLKEYIKFLQKFLKANKDNKLMNPDNMLLFGAYYGELFIEIFGGQWDIDRNKGTLFYGWPKVFGWTTAYKAAYSPCGLMQSVLRDQDINHLLGLSGKPEWAVKFKKSVTNGDREKLDKIINYIKDSTDNEFSSSQNDYKPDYSALFKKKYNLQKKDISHGKYKYPKQLFKFQNFQDENDWDIGVDIYIEGLEEKINKRLASPIKLSTLYEKDAPIALSLQKYLKSCHAYIEDHKDEDLLYPSNIEEFGTGLGVLFESIFGGSWGLTKDVDYPERNIPVIRGWANDSNKEFNPYSLVRKIFEEEDISFFGELLSFERDTKQLEVGDKEWAAIKLDLKDIKDDKKKWVMDNTDNGAGKPKKGFFGFLRRG